MREKSTAPAAEDTVMTSTVSDPGYTFISRNPVRKIDYILYSPGFSSIDADVIRSDASDHFGIAAKLVKRY